MKFEASTRLPTKIATFTMTVFTNTDDLEVVSVHYGELDNKENIAVRVHSSCFTSEVLGSNKCDCKQQLEYSLEYIRDNDGIVIYLQQEGRGIGLSNKMRAYALQEKGIDTIEANTLLGLPVDARTYEDAKDVLEFLNVKSIRLLTNNPEKIEKLTELDIKVTGRVPVPAVPTVDSIDYLDTKQKLMGHMIKTRSLYETESKENKKVTSGRPFVHVNFAITEKSEMSDTNGKCRAISCSSDWRRVHQLRESYDAIAVGANTWINDGPLLTCRQDVLGRNPKKQPHRVIFIGHHDCNVEKDVIKRKTFVIGSQNGNDGTFHYIESKDHDLSTPLKELKQQGVMSILVEGGPSLIQSFIEQQVVDKLTVYVASKHYTASVQAFSKLLPGLAADEVSAEEYGEGTLLTMNLTDVIPETQELDVAV